MFWLVYLVGAFVTLLGVLTYNKVSDHSDLDAESVFLAVFIWPLTVFIGMASGLANIIAFMVTYEPDDPQSTDNKKTHQ